MSKLILFDQALELGDIYLIKKYISEVELSKLDYNTDDVEILKILKGEKRRRQAELVAKRKNLCKFLLITYKVRGFDHEGYCSGCEECSDEEPDEWTHEEIVITADYDNSCFVKRKLENKYLSDFDDTNSGCTSGGSGYCKGFWQEYKAIEVRWIKNIVNI